MPYPHGVSEGPGGRMYGWRLSSLPLPSFKEEVGGAPMHPTDRPAVVDRMAVHTPCGGLAVAFPFVYAVGGLAAAGWPSSICLGPWASVRGRKGIDILAATRRGFTTNTKSEGAKLSAG